MTEQNSSTDIEVQIQSLMAATGLDEETVRKILVAQDSQHGEAVETVRYNPETGEVAHRVKDGDIVKWRISHPTEGCTYEMAPTKETWELIQSPRDTTG